MYGNEGKKGGRFEVLVSVERGGIFLGGEETHHLRTATAGRGIGGDGGGFGILGRGG